MAWVIDRPAAAASRPPLDRRHVFADRVHGRDRQAAAQQIPRQRNLVVEREPCRGRGHHGRRPSREQHHEQLAATPRIGRARQRPHRGLDALRIGHRMRPVRDEHVPDAALVEPGEGVRHRPGRLPRRDNDQRSVGCNGMR